MNVYMDSSALVKQYLREAGSHDVAQWLENARTVGTAAISRVEVTSALARAERRQMLDRDLIQSIVTALEQNWPSLVRLHISVAVIATGTLLARQYALRGYDAVHLAAALLWQQGLDQPVHLATFDRELWDAGRAASLSMLPIVRP